ncbi:type II toxin-antitoxin system VapC family toxin [Myxococcus sp. K38C18041901]|uniref:type II toxin-antitoxin system VapC family toxin n=1 Tax=Myxococcus guangdongensis TaxID=2906760 RepID=UPI0020A7A99D|nr:PIN domain-containing protein [Myxococcus guangdongensis]MCP3063489.1 type II toxin-antitoxin system VapC family toxin [Myxococcus guangdongensis]
MSTSTGLVLLDTNILVHLLRASSLGKKVAEDHALLGKGPRPLISVVTVGEALAFAKKRGWGAQKVSKLHALLRQLVVVDIHLDAVLERYANFDAFCGSKGRALGKNDLWIAATASAVSALLLTTDKDFDLLHSERLLARSWFDPAPVGGTAGGV